MDNQREGLQIASIGVAPLRLVWDRDHSLPKAGTTIRAVGSGIHYNVASVRGRVVLLTEVL